MPLPARDVLAALTRKGFKRSNSGDVRLIYHRPNGTKSIVSTMVSHGEGEIGENLLAKMCRQTKLTRQTFGRFVACTFTQEQYEEHLLKTGAVKPIE